MADVTSTISSRELREQLSDVIARVSYGGERVGVTKNGKLAAIILSVEDVEALEAFEEAQDLAAYREAKGLAGDPMAAYAASGYAQSIIDGRQGGAQAGWGA